MKSQRYEILALASTGQIAPEEADRLLIALGTKQRKAAKILWTAAFLLTLTGLILGFHQGERIRLIFATCLQNLDSIEILRRIHMAISRFIQAL
jgi:hypothetical protein